MSNEFLNSLLKEYEQKKLKAELDLEKRKEILYSQIPKLQEIENELNSCAILTAKNILNNEKNSLYDFHNKVDALKKEKELIIKSLNIDSNYFKPFYECQMCKDTGYLSIDNYKTQMCPCLKQKLLDISFNKSNISNLKKENFETFNDIYFSDDVDISKYKLNISPRTNIRNIKEKAEYFVENFDSPDCKNLLFTGNTGLR